MDARPIYGDEMKLKKRRDWVRDKRLIVRLSEDEMRAIEAKAEGCRTLSEFARRALLGYKAGKK